MPWKTELPKPLPTVNSKDRYVLLGNPIGHSHSPHLHAAFAKQTLQNLVYEKIEPSLAEFEACVHHFFSTGGKGANVTTPFKQRAFLMADDASQAAKSAGSANTLLLTAHHKIFAHNTDGVGFMQDLLHRHQYNPLQKRILILGAGGAAASILVALIAHGVTQIVLANRSLEKATCLAKEWDCVTPCLLNDLHQIGAFDLIIQATSAELKNQSLDLPTTLLKKSSFCYDLNYHVPITEFLHWSKTQGVLGVNGQGMLIEQAAEAFFLWRGIRPDTTLIDLENLYTMV